MTDEEWETLRNQELAAVQDKLHGDLNAQALDLRQYSDPLTTPIGPLMEVEQTLPAVAARALIRPELQLNMMMQQHGIMIRLDDGNHSTIRRGHTLSVAVDVGKLIQTVWHHSGREGQVSMMRALGKAIRLYAPDAADLLEGFGS